MHVNRSLRHPLVVCWDQLSLALVQRKYTQYDRENSVPPRPRLAVGKGVARCVGKTGKVVFPERKAWYATTVLASAFPIYPVQL